MWLLLSSLGVGAVLALLFALALTSSIAPLRWVVGAYTYVIRGTPLLIQLYLIYYGLAQLDWIQARWNDVWPWTHFKEPFFCALLAFSLNTAGYTAEMLAGAIRETAADVESGFADGLTSFGASITDALGGNGEDAPDQKIKKIKDEIDTLGEVLAAQGGNVLVSGIDAFVDSINGAEVSFREFAQSVLADLEKMLIKFLAFQAIKATIGVADGGIGSILSKALGFAAGGTFTVPNGGGGGTDSVPVFFRATPGERVTVSTPGQQQMQGGGAQPVVNFKSVNVVDMGAAAREYANSAENEQVVLNIIMRNESKLRGLLT